MKNKADFLWPYDEGSTEEAGYEFANAKTEEYREFWWCVLLERTANNANCSDGRPDASESTKQIKD